MRLEPDEGKLSSPVLRGLDGSNLVWLPDYEVNGHCDLMDVLSDNGASPRLSLDEAARALGLPGKWNGHGAAVAEQAHAGDFAAIDRYCEGDVSFGRLTSR